MLEVAVVAEVVVVEEICTLQRIIKNNDTSRSIRDIDTMMMNTYAPGPSCPPQHPTAVQMELRVDMPCSIQSPPDRSPTQRHRCIP